MRLKEAELVNEEFVARKDTYNLCHGGKGGFGYINENGLSGYSLGAISANKTESKRKSSSENLKRLHQSGIIKPNPPNTTGHQHSKISKNKISNSMRGKQRGERNSQYGSKWMNKDGYIKKVSKENVEKRLTEGWNYGRVV